MRKSHKGHRKTGVGKVVTGIFVGGVVGATLGWLTAPTSGADLLRRFRGGGMDARARARTAAGNIESQARELVEDARDSAATRTRISSVSG